MVTGSPFIGSDSSRSLANESDRDPGSRVYAHASATSTAVASIRVCLPTVAAPDPSSPAGQLEHSTFLLSRYGQRCCSKPPRSHVLLFRHQHTDPLERKRQQRGGWGYGGYVQKQPSPAGGTGQNKLPTSVSHGPRNKSVASRARSIRLSALHPSPPPTLDFPNTSGQSTPDFSSSPCFSWRSSGRAHSLSIICDPDDEECWPRVTPVC